MEETVVGCVDNCVEIVDVCVLLLNLPIINAITIKTTAPNHKKEVLLVLVFTIKLVIWQ